MRSGVIALALACALARPAAAQDTTGAQLTRARGLYELLELERALPLLREIVSPSWRFDVTGAQRVEANVYLGATFMLLGARDSAVTHFRAALERDPFADLDPARFTPDQVTAFEAARRTVFAVATRPVPTTRLDPRTSRLTLTIAATHAASLRCEIRPPGGADVFPLFEGDISGLREVEWDGTLGSGRLAPTGRYMLVVRGQSRLDARVDSARVYFDVQQIIEPLEDTLADIPLGAFLPERYAGRAAGADLLKGFGVAAGALMLANVASDGRLGRSQELALPVAGVGFVFGLSSFFNYHSRPRPENIAVNERRRAERLAANDAIRTRNADRIAATVLMISPAAGTGN
jgi:hypothetical protein